MRVEEIRGAGLDRRRGRELEILQLVAQGYSKAETARTLRVAEQTVEFHLSNVDSRLGRGNGPDGRERCRTQGLTGRRRGEKRWRTVKSERC
jgi:DNA-binding NarL/FixJ family response regulator